MTAILLLILMFLSCGAMIVFIYLSGRRMPTRNSHSTSGCEIASRIVKREQHDVDFPFPEPSDISDPDRALVWATQIPALRFVHDREPRGSYYTPLKLIHLELARRYPEIYDGRTFHQWVEFYVRIGLFRFEDDAIHLTRSGHQFLEFLDDPKLRETASR